MRTSSLAQRLEGNEHGPNYAVPGAIGSGATAQPNRLPVADTDLSEADICYSVRFKQRRAQAGNAGHRRPQNDNSSQARTVGEKQPRTTDRIYMAYALLIGLLAGLAIPSVVVMIAVLILNPSAFGAIYAQLLLAVMAIG